MLLKFWLSQHQEAHGRESRAVISLFTWRFAILSYYCHVCQEHYRILTIKFAYAVRCEDKNIDSITDDFLVAHLMSHIYFWLLNFDNYFYVLCDWWPQEHKFWRHGIQSIRIYLPILEVHILKNASIR